MRSSSPATALAIVATAPLTAPALLLDMDPVSTRVRAGRESVLLLALGDSEHRLLAL
jgi:hypothetical protein